LRTTTNNDLFSITLRDGVVYVAFAKGAVIDQELLIEAVSREIQLYGEDGLNDAWDFRGCQVDEGVVYQTVVQLVSYIGSIPEARTAGKTALIVDQDFMFGLARMFETLAASLPFEVRVLRDGDKALAWLHEDSDEDSG
jgi:hypothetical protein